MKIPFISKYFGGSYLGGFLDTYGRAGTIINGLQFMFVVVILYTTSAQPYINKYVPWMTFTHYIILAFALLLSLLAFTRVMVVPSSYTFTNRQVWDNNNPMRGKLEKLEKNQKKIMDKLGVKDE